MRRASILVTLIGCLACGADTGSASRPPPVGSPTGSEMQPAAGTGSGTQPGGTSVHGAQSGGTQPGGTTGGAGLPPGSGAGATPGGGADSGEPGGGQQDAQDAGIAMDECGLDTGWEGDEYCILPPPPDEGFQIHIGPSDYENPEPQYVMQPGTENTVTMTATSGNTSDVFYYRRQYRMRPGSHHVIVSTGGLGGRRLGGTQNLAKDNPTGPTPPENEGVGLPLPARSQVSVNMHYYNFGTKPILKEVWINFWYKDQNSVKEPASEVFSFADVRAAVAQSHVVVGASCPITKAGRILTLYGHRHNNNVRFTAWRVRGDQRDVLIEDFDPVHPAVLEYNSLTQNPEHMPGMKRVGGWSGMLDVLPGDKIDFECEIINKTNKDFTGANEANDDEMCILVGDSVGTQIPGFCQALPARDVR